MMSSNDIFHPCWDQEPMVSCISYDRKFSWSGSVSDVRRFIKYHAPRRFEVFVYQDEDAEPIGLPDVAVTRRDLFNEPPVERFF